MLECFITEQGSAGSLLPAFDLLAGLLLEAGSEAREAPAVRAHADIRARLRDSGSDSVAITRHLVRALRLMAAQLRLLQIDMSNSTLRMLAATVGGREGIKSAPEHRSTNTALHVTVVLIQTRF